MNHFILNKVARVIEGTDEPFRHVFGGRGRHNGTTPQDCKTPLHLLYTFDTSDPAFPLQIPGIRHLPLYYSFPYNAGACGYRVKSETEIEVIYMETKEIEPDFPYENYPSEFPERNVRLAPISYEEHKSLIFYLQTDDKEILSDADRNLIFGEFDYPFTQVGGIHRMWQDVPDVQCPNKSCENSRFRNCLKVFAVVWNRPHEGVFLWEKPSKARYKWDKDNDGHNDDIQVVFQFCPKCFSIHACNRCT
jgi:hypothetical protein